MPISLEMKLLSVGTHESIKNGKIVKAVFELHPDEASALDGKAGKRFGAALVEIDDNEQPAPEKPKQNKLVQRAAILCNEQLFKNFIKEKFGKYDTPTEEVVRDICEIKSRAELATNPDARERFHSLLTSYEMWKRGE